MSFWLLRKTFRAMFRFRFWSLQLNTLPNVPSPNFSLILKRPWRSWPFFNFNCPSALVRTSDNRLPRFLIGFWSSFLFGCLVLRRRRWVLFFWTVFMTSDRWIYHCFHLEKVLLMKQWNCVTLTQKSLMRRLYILWPLIFFTLFTNSQFPKKFKSKKKSLNRRCRFSLSS